jgi:hypothetical protein
MAAESTRDELLGRLLGVPLDGFVEQRNRLVRELREQGDRVTAAWLAGLRRPSPGIWALDQLARGDPQRLRALLDDGAELRAVQGRAIRGDREAAAAMRELGVRVQRGVDDVVRRAAALLRDAGHGAGTDTIHLMAATVRTAMAADVESRRQLAEGLLLGPLEEGSVFGFDLSGPPELRVIEGGAARRDTSGAARERQTRELRERAERAVAAAEAAEGEASQRREEAEARRARVDELRAQIRALDRDLEAAEAAAQSADAAAREAQGRARTARRDADAAEAEVPPS